MNAYLHYLPLIACWMIGGAFIIAGINNIIYRKLKIKAITDRGLPLPTVVFWIGIILQTIGGLSVIFKVQIVAGVLILIVFTIVASFIFHDFWRAKDDAFRMKLQGFVSNINIVGALILVGYFID